MKKDELEKYKDKLEEERTRLVGKIEESKEPTNFGDDIDSGDEEADEAEEFANDQAIVQTLRERVNEIDQALARIEMGSYGICENCGGPISQETLRVAPESEHCKACKQEPEN